MIELKPPPNSAPRRRRPVRLVICLLTVLLVVLVGERWRGQWALERWKNDATASGEILEAKRLWPAASAVNRDFYERLERANRNLQSNLDDYAGSLSGFAIAEHGNVRRGSQQPRAQVASSKKSITWQDLNARVAANEDKYQLLREMMKRPARSMGRDIERSLKDDTQFPSFVGVRIGAQMMQAAVLNDLHNGNLEQALQDLTVLLAIAKLYQDDPSLVNYMIRIAVLGLSESVCWDALQAEGWTEPQLAILQNACLDVSQLRLQLRRTMESERACGVYAWRRLRSQNYQAWENRCRTVFDGFGVKMPSSDAESAWRQWVFHPLWQFSWADLEELEYLQHMQKEVTIVREAVDAGSWSQLQEHVTAMRVDYHPPLAAWRFYGSLPLVSRMTEMINNPNNSITAKPAYPYSDFSRAYFTSMKALTRHEMFTTAVAIKRYSLNYGQPPVRLDELLPEYLTTLPTDLMDGKPLRYRANPDATFTLYSIGANLRDDDGDLTPEAATDNRWAQAAPWNGKDWVWPQLAKGKKPF